MARLEDLAPGIILKGIHPQTTVTIVAVTRHGADSVEIVYKDAAGGLGTQLLYRGDTEQLEVVDEAHKMSATFFAGEARFTKRYHLGELLGETTHQLLLLSATPHNGKEEDFQLFLRLLDMDRFEGRFRDGVHKVDVSDLMRHLVKEQLYKFDSTPLFPERLAYAVNYRLSDLENRLYQRVAAYVREEFNRAETLENHGRKGTLLAFD